MILRHKRCGGEVYTDFSSPPQMVYVDLLDQSPRHIYPVRCKECGRVLVGGDTENGEESAS